MNTSRFEFAEMVKLLRCSENDGEVRSFFGQPAMSSIARTDYYGSLEFRSDGVDVVFKESPWVVPATQFVDPKVLHVSAFHLHREGHEGYAGYSGQLPNGITFGDSELELIRKMGQPVVTGGGGIVPVLKRPIPRWLRYSIGDMSLHFQLDANGGVELVTLSTLDVQAKPR
jgi:hypothetical protein